MSLDRGQRTYHLSDERLRAFKTLSTEDKLRWQEELSTFIRLVRSGKAMGQDTDVVLTDMEQVPGLTNQPRSTGD
mgnify:CR=1 FL=1